MIQATYQCLKQRARNLGLAKGSPKLAVVVVGGRRGGEGNPPGEAGEKSNDPPNCCTRGPAGGSKRTA